jgi:serine/threonine protein kinase
MPKKLSIENNIVTIYKDGNNDGIFSNERLVYMKLQNIKSDYFPIVECIEITENMIKLKKYKNTLNKNFVDNKIYLNIILQVCKIILFLRNNNMKHNDLGPDNFVYDEIENIKIIDFESVTTIDGKFIDEENEENHENFYIPNNETNEFLTFVYYLISPRLTKKLSIQQFKYLDDFFCDYANGMKASEKDIEIFSNISNILDEENRELFNFIIDCIKENYQIETIMNLIMTN